MHQGKGPTPIVLLQAMGSVEIEGLSRFQARPCNYDSIRHSLILLQPRLTALKNRSTQIGACPDPQHMWATSADFWVQFFG